MTSAYTLLIVESPVIARIIQKRLPSSVYVIATGGYCWKPKFDPSNLTLKAVADPALRSVRKELKEQSKWAVNIIVATDADPAGDFIAWSVAKFLKSSRIKRGRIRSLSKASLLSMLDDVMEFEIDLLETRLRNRFLIRHEWYQQKELPEMDLAGLISLFSGKFPFRHFLDEENTLYQSSNSVYATPDEWISLSKSIDQQNYFSPKPLSLYDLIPSLVAMGITTSYRAAQEGLQKLFEATIDDDGISLVSYPRTNALSFYGETWEMLNDQFLKTGSSMQIKPRFLRDTADPDTPHESIHPLDLGVTPEKIKNLVPSEIYNIYSFIFKTTVEVLTMPSLVRTSWESELNPEIFFHQSDKSNLENVDNIISLIPRMTLSDAGKLLDDLGVLKPSAFASSIEKWLNQGWITVSNGVLYPGKTTAKYLGNSEQYYHILSELNRHSDSPALRSETIRSIFASY